MIPSIVIDSDGGIDDILAILTLIGSKEVTVSLINATCGNVDTKQAYRNIKAALKLIGGQTSVSLGKNTSLDGKIKRIKEVHGKDGLGNTFLADNVKALNPLKASTALKGAVEANKTTRILAMGPLTNIAEALLRYPHLSKRIEEIWMMGGTFKVLDEREFNFSFDPRAVEIVFESKIPIRIISLDVTKEILFTREFIDNFKEDKTKINKFLSNVLNFAYKFSCDKRRLKAAHLPDLVTACLFLDRGLAGFRRIRVKIDLGTGCLSEDLGGREVLIAENLNRRGIKKKALRSLFEFSGGEINAII